MQSLWLALALATAAAIVAAGAAEPTATAVEADQGCDLAFGAVCLSGCSRDSLTPIEVRVNGHQAVPCVE